MNRATDSTMTYKIDRVEQIPGPLISGYEVFRFGVPMIGEYVNTNRVTISPVVPGAQYRITAWTLGHDSGSRSATPAVEYVTTGEGSE